MGLQCCQPHWNALRGKLDERGLSHLVALDGREAVNRLVEGLEAPTEDRQADAETFDPLMGSWFRVMGAFMENEPGAMFEAEMVCPFCRLDRQREGLAENWLNGVSDEALEASRDLNLVPKEQ